MPMYNFKYDKETNFYVVTKASVTICICKHFADAEDIVQQLSEKDEFEKIHALFD